VALKRIYHIFLKCCSWHLICLKKRSKKVKKEEKRRRERKKKKKKVRVRNKKTD
jgi:hypothetical protein